MALPRDYADQSCSLARTLEVVGERWTLLLVRDAFYGVRRFGDFVSHLGIPRAVLTDRLRSLTEHGVLVRIAGGRCRMEYELTPKGLALWPILRALLAWGDEYYGPDGPRRVFQHASDSGILDPAGRCPQCGGIVAPQNIVVVPGPGASPPGASDAVAVAMSGPHRMLEPLMV